MVRGLRRQHHPAAIGRSVAAPVRALVAGLARALRPRHRALGRVARALAEHPAHHRRSRARRRRLRGPGGRTGRRHRGPDRPLDRHPAPVPAGHAGAGHRRRRGHALRWLPVRAQSAGPAQARRHLDAAGRPVHPRGGGRQRRIRPALGRLQRHGADAAVALRQPGGQGARKDRSPGGQAPAPGRPVRGQRLSRPGVHPGRAGPRLRPQGARHRPGRRRGGALVRRGQPALPAAGQRRPGPVLHRSADLPGNRQLPLRAAARAGRRSGPSRSTRSDPPRSTIAARPVTAP